MDSSYKIKLNFLGFEEKVPAFQVFRKLRKDSDVKPETPGLYGFSLPVSRDDRDTRNRFWISFVEQDGFEQFLVDPRDNVHLTKRALFHSLCQTARSSLAETQFEIPRDGFYEEIEFNFERYDEGVEQLKVQPYYLKAKRKHGWLLDFHFKVADGVPFSRRIQQLSLSLDRQFKRNLNYYTDRVGRINKYIVARRDLLDQTMLPGTQTPLTTRKKFEEIPAKTLRSKVYQFGNAREGKSQFVGLKNYGPLEPLTETPKLIFAFREKDRPAARILAQALKGGRRERYSFPGFEALFKTKVLFDANPIVLQDFSVPTFETALKRVQKERETHQTTLPVFVLPDGDDNGYLEHKSVFTHAGIPTQVCTTKIINDDYSLKWSVGNIALQIFCKSGGKPWKVRPTIERTLIMGISQAHKLTKSEDRTVVDKHFAFSVLSDNSGLFQQIEVLGDSGNTTTYFDELKRNLAAVLAAKSKDYDRVVIHTSFKMKNSEVDVIEEVVRQEASNSKCKFAVVKVNNRNRFFGINPKVNSLVPFEATEAKLGRGEYLIWFEGIFPDKQTVSKAFPGPTHVEIMRMSEESEIEADSVLQDLVNLSGANWRGFNAKSAPVSIFYCHLIAKLVGEFQDNGLPLPQVSDLQPWFL